MQFGHIKKKVTHATQCTQILLFVCILLMTIIIISSVKKDNTITPPPNDDKDTLLNMHRYKLQQPAYNNDHSKIETHFHFHTIK
jgi:septal ring-binding cell division protein DamX